MFSSFFSPRKSLPSSPVKRAESSEESGSKHSADIPDEHGGIEIVEVLEHERRSALGDQWGDWHLTAEDPKHFTFDRKGYEMFPFVAPGHGWAWEGGWFVQRTSDEDGWVYCEHLYAQTENTDRATIRWRSWIRTKVQSSETTVARSPMTAASNIMSKLAPWRTSTRITSAHVVEEEFLPMTDYDETNKEGEIEEALRTDNASEQAGQDENLSFDKLDFQSSISDCSEPDIDPSDDDYALRGLDLETEALESNSDDEMVGRRSKIGSNSKYTKLKDPQLVAVGKQLRALEAECERVTAAKDKEWERSYKSAYKSHIRALDQQLKEKMKQLRKEKDLNPISTTTKQLEEEVAAHGEAVDDMKKRFYFPKSRITTGGNGVFIALDDFWLENASGQFVLDLIPHSSNPQIILALCGTQAGGRSGVSIRALAEGFKLRGDKGTKVPTIELSQVKVSATVRVTMNTRYTIHNARWQCAPKDFKLELLSFRGPFGTRRSVISSILSMVTPLLRKEILAALPPELGLFMCLMETPFCLRGQFDISGTPLQTLMSPFQKNDSALGLLKWTHEDARHFLAAQKSMDYPKPLRTLLDCVHYTRFAAEHTRSWSSLRYLWNDGIRMYSEKRHVRATIESTAFSSYQTLSFETPINVAERLIRKPLRVQFSIEHVEGTMLIGQLMGCVYSILHRVAQKGAQAKSKKASEQQQTLGPLVQLLTELHKSYAGQTATIALISSFIQELALKLNFRLRGGPNGDLVAHLHNVHAVAPKLLLNLALNFRLLYGFRSIVPYLVETRTAENGGIRIVLKHLEDRNLEWASVYRAKRHSDTSSGPPISHWGSVMQSTDQVSIPTRASFVGSGTLVFSAPQSISEGISTPTLQRGKRGDATSCDFDSGEYDIVTLCIQDIDFSLRVKPGQLSSEDDVIKVSAASSPSGEDTASAASGGGMSVSVATTGVTMRTTIGRIDMDLDLPRMLNFIDALFSDTCALSAYLPAGMARVQDLDLIKVALKCAHKYLLSEDLRLAVNVEASLRTVQNDLELAIRSAHTEASEQTRDRTSSRSNHPQSPKPIYFCARFDVWDIIDDIKAVLTQLMCGTHEQ